MIFADVRLRGVMDGIDLAREVKMRWPLLPVILTSGHARERVGELRPSVAYMPKPWQPLNVLIAAQSSHGFPGIQPNSGLLPRLA
jgi:CheY-like chemotaxis protein